MAFAAVSCTGASALAGVTIQSQQRFIEGTTSNTADDGSVTTNGPLRIDAVVGDFSTWLGTHFVPGNISVSGTQEGGWDPATGTFTLSQFLLTIGGGGPAGTAGTSTGTNRFSYTFTVDRASTYTINGLLGSQPPLIASFQFTGPGVSINNNSSTGDVTFTNATGTLTPGTYTLSAQLTGTVSYVGSGGNGAGAGSSPLTVVITPLPVATVVSQDRFIEGITHTTLDDGSVVTNGPVHEDAPAGDFGPWNHSTMVPGNVTVSGSQNGGWNGLDTFSLDGFVMSIGGGGPSNTAGTSTGTDRWSFTFTVPARSTYTINGLIGSQPPLITSFQLTGPGVAINDNSSTGDVTYTDRTGNMTAGTYTLTVQVTGTVSYVGPGGTGAGGGASPLTVVIAPVVCRGDFNHSGGLEIQDIFDYLNAWFAGNPDADFNGGGLAVQDIFDFLNAWFAGC
jgi:hypothetical protein